MKDQNSADGTLAYLPDGTTTGTPKTHSTPPATSTSPAPQTGHKPPTNLKHDH